MAAATPSPLTTPNPLEKPFKVLCFRTDLIILTSQWSKAPLCDKPHRLDPALKPRKRGTPFNSARQQSRRLRQGVTLPRPPKAPQAGYPFPLKKEISLKISNPQKANFSKISNSQKRKFKFH